MCARAYKKVIIPNKCKAQYILEESDKHIISIAHLEKGKKYGMILITMIWSIRFLLMLYIPIPPYSTYKDQFTTLFLCLRFLKYMSALFLYFIFEIVYLLSNFIA